MRSRSVLRVSLVLLSLLVCAACGGGGGSTAPAPPPAGGSGSPPAPVASTYPAVGSVAADPGDVLRVAFDRPMRSATIHSATFTVRDSLGRPLPGTVTYADNEAVFVPASRLSPGTAHVATLSPEILDSAGNPIAAAAWSWSFTVRDGMEPPVALASPDGQGNIPLWGASVAVGENGDTFAAWYWLIPNPVDRQLDQCELHVRRRPAGGDWEAPVRVAQQLLPILWDRAPGIFVDGKGNALLVWNGLDQAIGHSRYVAGTGWEAPGSLPGSGSQIRLTGNASGNAVLTYLRVGFEEIEARLYTPGTGWSEPVPLSTGGPGMVERAHTAMDPAGNVMAVWHEADSNLAGYSYHVWSRRLAAGAGWGTPVRVSGGDARFKAWMPRVGVDDRGRAVCVWAQFQSGYRLFSASFDPESGWGSPAIVSGSAMYEARYPGLAVGPQGEGIASLNGWAVPYSPATGWAAPLPLAAGTLNSDPYPLLLDQFGNAVACWIRSDGLFYRLEISRHAPGAGWSPPEIVGLDGNSDATIPRMAMNRRGQTTITWLQGGTIWSRRVR